MRSRVSIVFNQFLQHFLEVVCQHDWPQYGSGPEAEAGAAYLIPVAQVTHVSHVPHAVGRAVAHRQEQVFVKHRNPHALNGDPTRHKYDLRWIGAGPVTPAQPSPQLVRYACKRATRFDQLQLDDRDYQWSM